ncbi:hypothetical protein [Schistocephalus solidus toti-like virus 2]|uniref:Uncharacterized protein n=1 Tax=Schistocephalus solidus toti-like virus 2 TaxID=2729341 RepID=A0A6M3RSK3_9VIRU|nr:hypothetical protein [Schistocephalus solidus toti-like virus 2]
MGTVGPARVTSGMSSTLSLIFNALSPRKGCGEVRGNAFRPRNGCKEVRGDALRPRHGSKVVRGTLADKEPPDIELGQSPPPSLPRSTQERAFTRLPQLFSLLLPLLTSLFFGVKAALSQAANPHSRRSRVGSDGLALRHIGDHSLTGTAIAPLANKLVDLHVEQNVVRYLENHLTDDEAIVEFTNQGRTTSISSTLTVPDPLGCARAAVISGTFKKWCPPNEPRMRITARYAIPEDKMDLANLQALLVDAKTLNTRSVAGAITAELRIPHSLAQDIASFATVSLERADNSAMYAKAWALAEMRQSISRWLVEHPDFVAGWNPVGADDFFTRSWADENVGDLLNSDILERRIVVLASDFSAVQRNCLRHIARGGIALSANGQITPRSNRIDWFNIPIAIYYSTPPGNIPLADFTPDDMRSTLLQLARTRGEEAHAVRGYTKAAVVVNQIRKVIAGAPVYYLPTVEKAVELHWAGPRDSNPIWRWIGKAPPQAATPYLSKELLPMETQTMEFHDKAMSALAALVSTATGLALHTNNLGGDELNWAAGQEHGPGAGLITFTRDLFQSARATEHVPLIFRIAVSELAQVSEIIISPTCFRQDGWCANFSALARPTAETDWAAAWEHRIPYPLPPLCTAWALKLWPATWGFAQADIHINLQHDVIPSAEGGWYADLGDSKYLSISQGKNPHPWIFIPYGALVLNALAQFWRAGRALPLNYRIWPRTKSPIPVPNGTLEVPLLAGDYNTTLNIYSPGVVRTYSWSRDVVLAPYLLAAALGPPRWGELRLGFDRHLDNAGLILPTVTGVIGAPVAPYTPFSFYGETPAASENSEGPQPVASGSGHAE